MCRRTALVAALLVSGTAGLVARGPLPQGRLQAFRSVRTSVRSAPRLLSDAASQPRDASQVEDLVVNAKSLFYTAYPKGGRAFVSNFLSGVTVSLAMIPEAVAFAFVAGVSPICGLWTTVLLGFFAAAFGGRGGVMSGASGAVAVVVASLMASHGAAYLSACVLLAGMMQVAAGYFRLGKFIKLVPQPVMLGFVNGLAVVMTQAQLRHFFDPATGALLSGARGVTMAALTTLTMVLVKMIPRVTTALPPSLAAVCIVTALTKALALPASTLIDIAGASTFAGGAAVLPKLAFPCLGPLLSSPLSVLAVITPYALTMAAVGLIESLLTVQLVDGLIDDGTRGSTSQECIGQGLGNMAAGLTGGMGGCALIGQSLINVQSGGTSRLSGMAMALCLGLGIACFAPLLGQVPIAALVGVMLLVCHSTFSWSSVRLINKIPRRDFFVILLVSAVTVWKDLAVAVAAGTIVSALSFAWTQSTAIKATTRADADSLESSYKMGWKVYALDGPLFFGSTQAFNELFDAKGDPQNVVIDFMGSRVADASALDAINTLCARYGELGKTVHLRHLSADCARLLERINGELPPYEVIEADPETDPAYEVASDQVPRSKSPA